jgi:hypothetical protein
MSDEILAQVLYQGWNMAELAFSQLTDILSKEYQITYHCMIDLLFDCLGLVCFAIKKRKLSIVIQLIPNQSNRRSMVQRYFPL